VQVTGTDTDYFIARDWDVALGRVFTDSEVRGGANLCLIGETVRSELFGAGDPTGSGDPRQANRAAG
jgi:putative ABC transport system permease protein